MAQFPDRHSSERKVVGFSEGLKPIDSIDYFSGRYTRSRFAGNDATVSGILKQTGDIIANPHSMLRGLTSELRLKLRREFYRYSHRTILPLH
jgi:hypothetical protein